MKWKDSEDQPLVSEQPDKGDQPDTDYFAEEENTTWPDESKSGLKSKLSIGSVKLSPVVLGVGLFAAALVLAALLFPRFHAGSIDGRLVAVEAKLQEIEDRFNKFDMVDDKVTRIWEQAKSFEGFKERFDRSEASMSLRMDHVASNLNTLQKRIETAEKRHAGTSAGVAVQNSPAPKPAEATAKKTTYHTVKARETLYSISKQYGLKIEDLMKFNNISANAVIHSGQKLIVAPGQ
jgi:LysM repeat protein